MDEQQPVTVTPVAPTTPATPPTTPAAPAGQVPAPVPAAVSAADTAPLPVTLVPAEAWDDLVAQFSAAGTDADLQRAAIARAAGLGAWYGIAAQTPITGP